MHKKFEVRQRLEGTVNWKELSLEASNQIKLFQVSSCSKSQVILIFKSFKFSKFQIKDWFGKRGLFWKNKIDLGKYDSFGRNSINLEKIGLIWKKQD